ncbi:MAG: hypothetical protein ABL917_03075, partial [Parcubacteria group bacterium]
MKEKLENDIKSVLEELGVENPKVSLDYPVHVEMGDFTSNVAMVHSKELGKNPFDLAEEIKTKINMDGVKVEVVKPCLLY